MERFKFSKKRSSVKYCPCGKSNNDGKFVPFEDFEKCGFCHSCCKTFYPNDETVLELVDKKVILVTTVYHDLALVEKTVLGNRKNNFIDFLRTLFPNTIVEEIIREYLIGTLNDWEGVVVFWQIDQQENVHNGKIMQYDPETGNRTFREDGSAYINNIKSRLKLDMVNAKQCLFGLHLVDENTKIVGLVESEKTATIMRGFKPEYLWLSTGSKGNFKYDLLKPIKHCLIVAFPDKGEYHNWKEKSIELMKFGFKIKVDDFLENSNYPLKTDLADVYINEKKRLNNHSWKSMHDSKFSKGSLQVYKMFQERNIKRLEMTKEESYSAIEYFRDNNIDIYRL